MKSLKYLLLIISMSSYAYLGARAEYILTKEQAREYRQTGYKMQMEGNFQGAMEMYEKAVAMDPQYAEVTNDLGVLYEGKGEIDRAISMYKRAIDIDRSYLPAYANLALVYEKKSDVVNASYYWQKRYELGQEGEYWREVARQHLLKLGTYPQLRRNMLEDQARTLSQDLVYQREQARLKSLEEARLHYNLGCNFTTKGDYIDALKEFATARYCKPDDAELTLKIEEMAATARRAQLKEKAEATTAEALNYLKTHDYPSASGKLKDSLDAVSAIAQEK